MADGCFLCLTGRSLAHSCGRGADGRLKDPPRIWVLVQARSQSRACWGRSWAGCGWGVRAHLLGGWGPGHVAAEGVLSQAQVAMAKSAEGPWPTHHLKQFQAHQARHGCCGGGNGWDDLTHDSLALPRTGGWVWDQGVGPGSDPHLHTGVPGGRVTWVRLAGGIP